MLSAKTIDVHVCASGHPQAHRRRDLEALGGAISELEGGSCGNSQHDLKQDIQCFQEAPRFSGKSTDGLWI